MTTSHSFPLTQESDFIAQMQGPIGDFWASREQGYLNGHNGTQLYWVSLTKPSNTKAIVMVNGRTETALKYQELFYDLSQQGYDIYSFDHRGQGMSERIAQDPHMGHVEDFSHYIDDLESMIAHFDLSAYQQRYLLGHSMGGAITTRFLQTKDASMFNAVALSAPMFGIHLPPILKPFARTLSHWMSKLIPNVRYAVGQSGYSQTPFAENELTHSQVRYQWGDELHLATEQIQMGGPTNNWVWQAIDAAKQCVVDASKVNQPLLLIQAGDDTIVDNQAHHQFMQNAAKSQRMLTVTGARHEVLLESDAMRNQALSEVLKWFEQHQ